MSIGWESISTCRIVKAAGAGEKARVDTVHEVISTTKLFVFEETPGKFVNETVISTGYTP